MDYEILDQLREFVKPHYADKDELHDLGHTQRLLEGAQRLAAEADGEIDEDLLVFGSYFHGMILVDESVVRDFLFSLGVKRGRVIAIMQATFESSKEATPETKEGGLLHDAHLLEGGREYQMTKLLVGGAQRGNSLDQTLTYIERSIIDRFTAVTETGKREYEKIETYRREFLARVRKGMEYKKPERE